MVAALCDRIAVMYAGRIVESGDTAAVLAAPTHPYTRRLIDCVPVLGQPERRLDAIEGLPPALDDLPSGCAFAPRCPRAQADCRAGEVALRPVERHGAGRDRAVRCLHPLAVAPDRETADG